MANPTQTISPFSHSHSHSFEIQTMAKANPTQTISPFCTQFHLRRLDDSTLRILDSLLATKDSNLLLQLRSCLKEFLRSQSLIVIRESSHQPVQHNLFILDFLVSAFAIIDDIQSCLALRYEGLLLRESKSVSYPELRVSSTEWINFAQDAFHHAFYSISYKACENALLCLDMNNDAGSDNACDDGRTIDEIQGLRDVAIRLSANHSVQVQTTEYLRKKSVSQKQTSVSNELHHPASTSFRNGIKQKNVRNLVHLQNQKQGQGSIQF